VLGMLIDLGGMLLKSMLPQNKHDLNYNIT